MPAPVKLRLFPSTPAEPPVRDLDLLATAVLLLDPAGRVTYANPAAENLFELSRQKFLRHTLADVFGVNAALAQAIERTNASGVSYTEQELELGIPGKPRLHLTCTVSSIDTPDAAWLLEFRHIDQQLKIAREERLAEQQQANRELIRSLAHEIKNPLGGIRGAAQLLERELDRPQLVEYTQVIIGEADRLRSLVNRLLAPHRAPSYRRINIHEVLVRVKGVVQAEFPAIPIVCDFDTSLPEFDADHEQLTQAALNVVRNAAQALAGYPIAAPEIRVVTRVARGVTLARRHHRLALAIAVEDNGPGVPESLRDREPEPAAAFATRHERKEHAIAQTFITQHGGTIGCDSAPGRTVFTILLPMSGESAPQRETRKAAP